MAQMMMMYISLFCLAQNNATPFENSLKVDLKVNLDQYTKSKLPGANVLVA